MKIKKFANENQIYIFAQNNTKILYFETASRLNLNTNYCSTPSSRSVSLVKILFFETISRLNLNTNYCFTPSSRSVSLVKIQIEISLRSQELACRAMPSSAHSVRYPDSLCSVRTKFQKKNELCSLLILRKKLL